MKDEGELFFTSYFSLCQSSRISDIQFCYLITSKPLVYNIMIKIQ